MVPAETSGVADGVKHADAAVLGMAPGKNSTPELAGEPTEGEETERVVAARQARDDLLH